MFKAGLGGLILKSRFYCSSWCIIFKSLRNFAGLDKNENGDKIKKALEGRRLLLVLSKKAECLFDCTEVTVEQK